VYVLHADSAQIVRREAKTDRIGNLSFDLKIIESERGVVASERRMAVENSNSGFLNEQLYATAFTAHPYMWPVVGWMSDIQNWKMEDLQNHFLTGYSPNNATMVVVGDVKTDEVFRLAEKYIEPIPAHEPPPKVATVEPEQNGERRVLVRKPAQLPIVQIAYHIPQTNHPDYYPLAVFQNILTSGQSSRLYRRLVDKDQLALDVSGDSSMNFDPGLFTSFPLNPRLLPARIFSKSA
jgi:zinc protease